MYFQQGDPHCPRDSGPEEGRPEPDRDQHWWRGTVLPLSLHCTGNPKPPQCTVCEDMLEDNCWKTRKFSIRHVKVGASDPVILAF